MSAETITTSGKSVKPAGRKRKILLILGISFLLLVSAGAAFYWWQSRPIKPVVLDANEQRALDQKVEAVQKRTYEPGWRPAGSSDLS